VAAKLRLQLPANPLLGCRLVPPSFEHIAGLPEQGQLVTVRRRRFVVTDVAESALDPPLPTTSRSREHVVTLSCLEDDALGEELQVVWQIEPGAQVLETVDLPPPQTSTNPTAWTRFSTLSAGAQLRLQTSGRFRRRSEAEGRLINI
jgi:hypothetical protein